MWTCFNSVPESLCTGNNLVISLTMLQLNSLPFTKGRESRQLPTNPQMPRNLQKWVSLTATWEAPSLHLRNVLWLAKWPHFREEEMLGLLITQRALILGCPLRGVRLIPLVVEKCKCCWAFHLIGLTCSSAAALLGQIYGYPKLHNTTLVAANVPPTVPQFHPHLTEESPKLCWMLDSYTVALLLEPVCWRRDYSPVHKASSKRFTRQCTTHVQGSPVITSVTRQLLVK